MNDPRFRLDPATATRLAREFGTPLYVFDEQGFRDRIRRYRAILSQHWGSSEISFASKSNSALQLLKIAHEEGTNIDVASEGEFRAALLAGVPPSKCHMHGNNKLESELKLAHHLKIGQIMIDNFEEIEAIADLGSWPETSFVLRVAPGVSPKTQAKISTGQADTKFGFGLANGAAEKALLRATERGLKIVGVHCHVGSQLFQPDAQSDAASHLSSFVKSMDDQHGIRLTYINVGGGLAAKYLNEDHPTSIEDYCREVVTVIKTAFAELSWQPTLAMEPGRSLTAESGLTLYTVGAVKEAASGRVFVSVDGGLSDNPRPVMYGAKYAVENLSSSGVGTPITCTISGRHCETDTLFEDITLPARPKRGDLIQVLTTGAYNAVMANNYNRFLRPATVLRQTNGEFALIQRRETYDDLFAREITL